jgi:hypothetical protein
MADGRTPGPLCQATNPVNVKDGTSCLAPSPRPTALGLCEPLGPPEPDRYWGFNDYFLRHLPSWLGGDPDRLRRFKDVWVHDHRALIKQLSAQNSLPPELLAGVAWIEVGGKPYDLKLLVYDVRRFDHSGDPWLEKLTITKKPEMTSMGPVKIQLRRAAEAMGVNYEDLNAKQRNELEQCVLTPENDLAIVARYLWQLKQIDFPKSTTIGASEIRIIGARYNRGPDLPLAEIKRNTSYGDFIADRIDTFQSLLADD